MNKSACRGVLVLVMLSLSTCTDQATAQNVDEIIGGIVDDLLKGRPIKPPIPPTPPPTIGVLGSVRVVNESRSDASIRIVFSNGRESSRRVRAGTTETWSNLPGGTEGTVQSGSSRRSFRIPGNGLLTLTIVSDGSIVPGRPPTGNGTGTFDFRNFYGSDAFVRLTYPNGGSSDQNVGAGRSLRRGGLAAGTRVYVVVERVTNDYRIPRESTLWVVVQPNGQTVSAIGDYPPDLGGRVGPPGTIAPPGGPGGGELGPNPELPKPPLPKPAANPLPRVQFSSLQQAEAQSLTDAANSDLRALLQDLNTAAENRLATIAGQLAEAGFAPESVKELTSIANSGRVDQISERLVDLGGDQVLAESRAESQSSLTSLATFRSQFQPLLTKFDAGADSNALASHIDALKQQGINLGVNELVEAMSSLRQHLMIRDVIIRSTAQPLLGEATQTLPVGVVNVIRHPRVHAGTNYLGSNGLILVGTNDAKIEITRATVSEALGIPVAGEQEPFPDWQEPEVLQGVMIHNPQEHQATLSYQLNDQPFQLEPGTQQFLDFGKKWIIEFSRGPNLPSVRYDISKEGTYAFTPEENGWNLRRKSFEVTVVNPPGGVSFNYLLNGEPKTIAPGNLAKHESHHPILVQFDTGNGSRTSSKLMTTKAPLYVALNSQRNEWELYSEPPTAGTQEGQVMALAFPKIQDMVKNRQSVLFEFEDPASSAPSSTETPNLLEALQSVQ